MEVKVCKHCGENFFEEDLNKDGMCKICVEGPSRFKYNEVDDFEE